MMDKYMNMSFKEFVDYCEQRTQDGLWGLQEAMFCTMVITTIYSNKVKFLGIPMKKRTSQLHEIIWESIKSVIINL